eukprot:scaffold61326_cov28-Tisochrysis_lutea.AAC.1
MCAPPQGLLICQRQNGRQRRCVLLPSSSRACWRNPVQTRGRGCCKSCEGAPCKVTAPMKPVCGPAHAGRPHAMTRS